MSEGHACVRTGRVVAVRLQDCRAMQAFTVFGAYMPCRGRPEREVRSVWEALGDAVADAGQGRIVLGDLNAELPDALEREERQPKLADELLQVLCEEEQLITAGPDQATYTRGAREGQCVYSQIDHILCDASVAPTVGESEVLPGLSPNDHWMLQAELLRRVDTHTGPQRHSKLPLWELDPKEWEEYAEEAVGAVREGLEALEDVPAGQHAPEDGTEGQHARRLRAIEKALMVLARRLLGRRQEQRDAQQRQQAPGSGHRSAEERLRSDVGRWEALCRVVKERDNTHKCFLPTRVHGGSRRAFAHVKQLTSIMRDGNLSSAQRRHGLHDRLGILVEVRDHDQHSASAEVFCHLVQRLAHPAARAAWRHGLQQVCRRELAKARAELAKIQTREGDGLVEAFEEAINEGGEGGVCVRLFEILKAATGKGKRIKWRGQKQEGKTRYKGARKPPVKLSSLYKDGDKAKGIVTGAKEVLAEVRAQAAATNGLKETFPSVAHELMARIRPFPEQQPAKVDWADDVCTWERFERAVGRAGADVGVGSDGYCGYLMRKAPLPIRRLYFDALRDVLTSHDFPKEWKLWECVLLMKPGEDPRDFGRRRDVWLMPHSLKVAGRMLMCEFESACEGYVPASQSGFSQDANAPSQTLILRMHRERCHQRKQGYYVLYADMGTYFMSICKEIQLVAEQWTGTRVEVSEVLRAMQHNLHGRVETAFGGTEPHAMPGVACGQGHECSPVRSKIMASFIQAMASQVCRGYRFGQTGVPQCWYCDDSAWLCEDLAGVQMAIDAMWVVARVSGLKVTIKKKDFKTRVGSKTAWMGVYYDDEGKECEVTGAKVEMPNGEEVPQVTKYKYLGTPLQIEYKGRHSAMRSKVVSTCCALLRQIGRVDMLGPRQTRRAIELAVAGVLGYYCRSTPMTWADCEKIEAVRASVLAQRGIAAETPRAAIFLPEEAGGAGHMHAYAYAAAAYMDQFHRALSGGEGEPARVVVSERIAETCRRLGCTEAPLTWEPPKDMALSEDDMVEAWLLAKRRAGMRGVRTDALLPTELSCCALCDGWRGRAPGSGPTCRLGMCPAEDGGEGVGVGGDGSEADSDSEVLRARRTADCFGGWEYLVKRGGSRAWVAHTRMVARGMRTRQLEEAQQQRPQAHSLRALLETRYGRGRPGSVGQMEAAISGRADQADTEIKLRQLTNDFIAHAEDQREAELPGTQWPNLRESPRNEGYRGVVYEPKQGVSYYRGVREATDVVDGVQQYRSRMGLGVQAGSREERLPAELRVSADEVARAVALGDLQRLPAHVPHEHVTDMGLGDAAKPQLRADPVARLHLRVAAWESGGSRVKTAGGVEVESGQINQEALASSGEAESGHSLREVCLPLHYRHRFTRAASVDGSAEDPRRHGGVKRKRVAYGVYEGMLPEAEAAMPPGGWDTLTAEQRALHCLGAGMWGGALPQDWDNNDAEAYAILRYLQSVAERAPEPAEERVLVMSDSRAVMDVIETVWRSGNAAVAKSRDRGAMIEAICALRAQLGCVLFVWTPGHSGVCHNEMADAVAKAHLGQPVEADVTRGIAGGVRTRDCLYEVTSDYAEGVWSLADRRCFRLARRCLSRWVQAKLLSRTETLQYDHLLADGKKYNYGEGGYCTEIVKDFGTGIKVKPGVQVADMQASTARVGFVMGRRAGDSGLPHERSHLRRLGHAEGDQDGGDIEEVEPIGCLPCESGRLTAAQRSHRLGCAGCARWRPAETCEGCEGWLGRAAGAAPSCTRAGCPGAADGDGWVLVQARGQGTRTPARTEMRVMMATWLAAGESSVGTELRVVPQGKPRKDGTYKGYKVKLALAAVPGHIEVKTQVRVARARTGQEAGVQLRLSSTQVRREGRLEYEDPRGEVRGSEDAEGGGAGITCGRARQAETVAERLRRMGTHVHEDTRYEVGAGRPLANLRHVLGECPGLPDRARRVEGLVVALGEVAEAVPRRTDTAAFLQLTRAARVALEASDQAVLTEERWRQVDAVLAAFVPDLAREGSTPVERKEIIWDVVLALQTVHGRAESAVQAWQATHRHELERRREQERYRGLLRTVMRAWREEADGRCARSKRVALPTSQQVTQGAPAGRLGADYLPTTHTTMQPRKPTKKEVDEEGEATAEARLHDEMMARELKCEGGSGVLPVARSAVPAGTQARLLLTYARLVEGGRLLGRRRVSWPEHKVGKGRKAATVPKGYPAQRDLWQRIERARLLELEEGVRGPVVYREPNARTQRRQARAVALQEAEAGAVGLHGSRGADRQIVDALQPVQASVEMGCGWGGGVEEEAKAVAEAGTEVEAGGGVEEEAKAVAEAGTEVEAEAEAKAKAEAEAEAEAEGEAEAKAEAEAEGEAKGEALAEAGPEADAEAGTSAQGGSMGSNGEGSSSDDGDNGGAAPPSLPARPWAFAGWDAHGGEAPYRRLHTDGVVRPRPVRAWWGTGLGLHTGDSGGGGAPLLPAGGRSARQLDLSDRFSSGHFSEHDWRAHDRACEPQLGLERERGHGGTDEAEAGAGPGQRARALWIGLCEAAVVRLAAGRLELARLVTGGRAGARHAAVPEHVQQLELDQDEAQAEPGDEWQQQQQQQQRGGEGGDEEQEEQEQQSAGAVARRGAEERGVEERGAALCAPRWRNFSGGGEAARRRLGGLGGLWGGGGGVGGVGGGRGGGVERNLGGVRVGLGHRFAAAWVRVRAAFGDG